MKVLLRYLFEVIWAYKRFFSINVILTFFNALFSILIPLYFKFYIDKLGSSYKNIEIIAYLLCFIILTLFSSGFSIIWHLAMTKLGTKMLFKMREDILKVLSIADFLEIKKIGIERIKSIVFSDTLTIFINTSNFTVQLVTKLLIFVCILTILFFINKLVFIFMIIAFLLGLIIANISRKKIYYSSNMMNNEFKATSSFINIFVDSLKLIQTNNLKDYFLGKHEKLCDSFVKTSLKNDKVQVFYKSLQSNLNALFSILFVTFIYLNQSNISVGSLILLFFYTNLVFSYSQDIESIISSIGDSLPAFENIRQLMNMPVKNGQENINRIESIRFEKVSFKFTDTEQSVFNEVSIILNVGDIINLRGVNGSGKTTFISLILQLYSPTSGIIFINDQNINDLEKNSFLNKVLYLDQDEKLLNEDLLTFFRIITNTQIDDSELKSFMNEWKLFDDNYIAPNNLTLNYDGSNLSSGQRRKLSIFKLILLYNQADIVIIDELDANLDTLTKEKLAMLKNELFKQNNKIIIDITHSDTINSFYSHLLTISDQNLELTRL